MSKRFYICPVTLVFEDDSDLSGSWKPTIIKYVTKTHRGTMDVGAQTVFGPGAWALVKVDFTENDQDHGRVVTDLDIDTLPNVAIDDILPSNQRVETQRLFTKYKVPGRVPTTETMRALLGRIARQANPAFNQDDWF